MVESTAALPSSIGTSGVTAIPSIEGTLQNSIPPYYKSYKITPLSIFRHIIYWSFVALIIFSISKLKRTSNEAFAFTFVQY
uniref:Uncharacterized protein n=1 Tax=Panagrolaimus davidi TaxID=227884 RepID=A0A914Q2B3_9BILA